MKIHSWTKTLWNFTMEIISPCTTKMPINQSVPWNSITLLNVWELLLNKKLWPNSLLLKIAFMQLDMIPMPLKAILTFNAKDLPTDITLPTLLSHLSLLGTLQNWLFLEITLFYNTLKTKSLLFNMFLSLTTSWSNKTSLFPPIQLSSMTTWD